MHVLYSLAASLLFFLSAIFTWEEMEGMDAIPKKAKHHSTLGLALHPSNGVDALYFCTYFVDYVSERNRSVFVSLLCIECQCIV